MAEGALSAIACRFRHEKRFGAARIAVAVLALLYIVVQDATLGNGGHWQMLVRCSWTYGSVRPITLVWRIGKTGECQTAD